MQQEKAKQDDGLSDLSDILGDLKSMAVDMGSEIDKSDNTNTYFHTFYAYVCRILTIVGGKFAGKTKPLIISATMLMSLTLVFKELINGHVTCFPNKKTPSTKYHCSYMYIILYHSLFFFLRLNSCDFLLYSFFAMKIVNINAFDSI